MVQSTYLVVLAKVLLLLCIVCYFYVLGFKSATCDGSAQIWKGVKTVLCGKLVCGAGMVLCIVALFKIFQTQRCEECKDNVCLMGLTDINVYVSEKTLSLCRFI